MSLHIVAVLVRFLQFLSNSSLGFPIRSGMYVGFLASLFMSAIRYNLYFTRSNGNRVVNQSTDCIWLATLLSWFTGLSSPSLGIQRQLKLVIPLSETCLC